MNALDFLIIAVIVLSALSGFRRGFVLGAFEVVMAVAGLTAAVLLYDNLASLLERIVSASAGVLNIAGFGVVYLIVQIPGFLLLRPLVRRFRRLTGIAPGVNPVDRVAGILPGAMQGLVIAYVVVLGLGFFSTATRAGGELAGSTLGLRLFRDGTSAALRVAHRTGFEFADFYLLTPRASGGAHVLPFEIDPAELRIDPAGEARMAELVNQERRARGLRPLEVDPDLAAVARAHAVEMFAEGYFAHRSPRTGSPFDRLSAAGIGFAVAGENLAFASNVERAHDGLMHSEGHRENILNPVFGRIGIGAITAPEQGTIYVQLFTD